MVLNIYYKFIDFDSKLYSLHFTYDAYICNVKDARGNLASLFFVLFLLAKVSIKHKTVNLMSSSKI